MVVLNGLHNFLQFISDNWALICAIITLILSVCSKIKKFMDKSDEEKIAIAKKQIQETVLKLVTDAEESYMDFVKAGSIKRAQVMEEIFLTYPILSKVTNQEELISWIDEVINESLKTMREVLEKNVEQLS